MQVCGLGALTSNIEHPTSIFVTLTFMKLIEGFERSRAALLQSNARRAFSNQPEIENTVREICESVRRDGDDALLQLERQFDCASLELENLRVSSQEIEDAWSSTRTDVKTALQRAADNIESFHRQQPTSDWFSTSRDGVFLGQRYTPIERVGMYAPNGRAAYPSTVLMLSIPAKVANVPQIVLASPPDQNGKCNSTILAAAKVAGISEIYKIGGAGAVAALAIGTRTIPKVDKIVGPGSIYVTLAKKYLYGEVGIDGLYGPSEVMILADVSEGGVRGEGRITRQLAPQLAADLVAQAEHGTDSFVALVCTSSMLCAAVKMEIEVQVASSTRSAILAESLQNAFIFRVDSLDEACAICDLAAAEHVEIWSRDALALSAKIQHAGAIFLNTPVPLGDYIAGPSHTLPTGATARFAHGVGVETFLKRTTLVSASQSALRVLEADLTTLAITEDLPGHARAVEIAAQERSQSASHELDSENEN